MNASSYPHDSAKIEAFLHVGELKLHLQRIGGGMLAVNEKCEVPPSTPAVAEVIIDGESQSMKILLTDGIHPDVEFINYTIVEPSKPSQRQQG